MLFLPNLPLFYEKGQIFIKKKKNVLENQY